MDPITKTLINRLVDKGIEFSVIPALIRDMINTISSDSQFQDMKELSRRIQIMGWYDFELDEHTLQLLVASMEKNTIADIRPHGLMKATVNMNS